MGHPKISFPLSNAARSATRVVITLLMLCVAGDAMCQDTPLLSGGLAFLTTTEGGKSTFNAPLVEPLIAAPIGPRLLIESRAAIVQIIAPGANGYDSNSFYALTYLQGDYIVSRHFTLVGGSFLLPFNTYNERLSPVWIGNFQDGPLSANLGLSGATGLGGMLRGSAISRPKFSIAYAAYFSARESNAQFRAQRSSGGRVGVYLPEKRLEIGVSYARLLQGAQENYVGAYAWWSPKGTALRLRSEYAISPHAQGYWVEADYRTQAFGGLDSFWGRFEPLFRMQQTFRRDTLVSDGLPLVNTQRADFGLDYNLPHNTRILTSYSRQFSSTRDINIWETGIVYRFLFPAWKGK